MEKKRYLITSALPYANGPLHIGHIAGAYLPADIFVRYQKLKGHDVAFICGSDEHGVPITIKARKEGKSPQDIVDHYHNIIKDAFIGLGINFDIYHRTSDPIHHETASEFFKVLYNKGELSEKEDEQFYDEAEKQFLADRYIVGTCPKCGYEKAYGDQCEKCGTSLSPKELINPQSALSGNNPVLKRTKHWYLPLDKYQNEWLEKWIDSHSKDWKPSVYGQCKSWLNHGLLPRAVTRDLSWGVPVPVENAEGKVLYVWFDAPIGYISATKAWAKKCNKNWEDYWKDKNTKLIHFIGKDNIVFHCLIFPAMLKAHGEYILPENVPANEFLNIEGEKLSTSRNWAVWVHEYLTEFKDQQDVLRYTLCSNAPESKDNDFTWSDFQARNNNELVAVLGNFVNRTLVLTNKYYEGSVPERHELTEFDKEVITEIPKFKQKIENSIERYRFREALKELMNLARLGNKYLADTEPWKLVKTDTKQVETIMNICLQITANLAVLCEPFLPFTSQKLKDILQISDCSWETAGNTDLIEVRHIIGKPSLLFRKIEDDEIKFQVEKLHASRKANQQKEINPQKEDISFDDFSKLDLRVGTILSANKVAKTKKLLQLEVDTGIDKRTVVSGIAEFYDPDKIVGTKVLLLVNLESRKIRGIQSQGMILMAENADGELCFVSPQKDFKNGSEVK